MNETPASTNASSNRCEVASSAVQPNTLPPKAMGANSIPDLPSLRFSMMSSCVAMLLGGLGRASGAGRGVERAEADARIRWAGELDAELGQGVEHSPDRRALDQAR